MAPFFVRGHMDEFTEEDWKALHLLDQEKDHPGAQLSRRWGAFPVSPHPDRVFFYPDIHFPYQDKGFLEYLDAKCDEFEPTHIIQIGDLLDCYTLSDFDKDPSRKETFNDERNMAVEWLLGRRMAHPRAIITVLEGNHEERLRRQVLKKMPGMHDMPELSIPSVLKLHSMNIRHFSSHGFTCWGMRIKHGNSTAKYAANAELHKHWMNGVSGHTHRKAEVNFTTAEGVEHTWRSLGHCSDMDYVDYTKGPNWQMASGHMLIYPDGRQEWTWLEG